MAVSLLQFGFEKNGTMKIYFDRQARRGRGGARWWLFNIRVVEEDPTTND